MAQRTEKQVVEVEREIAVELTCDLCHTHATHPEHDWGKVTELKVHEQTVSVGFDQIGITLSVAIDRNDELASLVNFLKCDKCGNIPPMALQVSESGDRLTFEAVGPTPADCRCRRE